MGKYKNVFLSPEEIVELKNLFFDWDTKVERLSEYMEISGRKYQNHFAVICKWAKEDDAKVEKEDNSKEKSAKKVNICNYQDTNEIDYDSLESLLLRNGDVG